jgi:hypothetical protein
VRVTTVNLYPYRTTAVVMLPIAMVSVPQVVRMLVD